MLERIRPIKPWIEHAVWENVIRRARSPQGAPDAKAAVLPDTMNDDGIVARASLFDPISEAGSVGIGAPARAERVHGNRIVAQPLAGRIVESDDLNLMAACGQSGGRLLQRFTGSSKLRVNRADRAKYFH